MAAKDTSQAAQSLSERPGWNELLRAVDELHAAEILLQDPVAAPRTTLPHLKAFWTWVVRAAIAGGQGPRTGASPIAWLDGGEPIPGIGPRERSALRGHIQRLEGPDEPSAGVLRRHVRDARALVAALEPEIGGMPMRRRRRRIIAASVGLVLLFAPLLVYTITRVEIAGSGPWRASYYPDRKLESEPVVVREQDINHDWEDKPPHEQIPPDKFSAGFDTCLEIAEAGEVVFQVNANDGARVFIDGELVIDAWDRDPKTRRRGFGSAEVELDAGFHHLRVEFFESLGRQSLKFVASLDGELPEPIPAEVLHYPGDEIDEADPCGHLGD